MNMDSNTHFVKEIYSQLESYPVLKSIPELKVVFTQEVGRHLRILQEAPEPSIENIPETEEALQELLQTGQFRNAFLLTTKILTNPPSSPDLAPNVLKIWQTRLNLYIRFGAANEARVELEQFSQLEDLPIQFGQNSLNGGVPFTLLLSVTHLHLICDQMERAQAKLAKLLHQCNENILFYQQNSNESFVSLWKGRELKVLSMLVNYGLERRDFKFAINAIAKIRDRQTDPLEIVKNESVIGKLFLQFGDLERAQEHFQEAARFAEGSAEGQLNVLLNKGLLSIANSDYQQAYQAYKEARNLQPENVIFTNNMAVCALYMGRSSEGIQLLEAALMNDATATIRESTIANLCALYRLQAAVGEAKKTALKGLVSKFAPDTFNCQVLETEN